MKNKNPRLSIITVSFNSVNTIEETILSVINQTYNNIEYIIIDGGSTDGTVDIIKKYSDKISYWVSKKDNGIYDAMNKGTEKSTGDYLNFMNSDDYFYNTNIISNITKYLNGDIDIVYGNMEVRYNNFKFIKNEPQPAKLWMGPVNHQSSFIKKETMEKYTYNINNKFVADFEFFLNVYYNKGKIIKINETIASFSNNGVSQKNDIQVIKDCYNTIKKYDNSLKIKIYYKILMIKPLIKRILPISIFKFIRIKIFN